MDEREWLESEDPQTMLNRLLHHVATPFAKAGLPKPSDRKIRLFAAACWRAASIPDRSAGWWWVWTRSRSWAVGEGWLGALSELEEVADGRRGAFTRGAEGYVCATLDVAEMLHHLSGLWVGKNLGGFAPRQHAAFAACALRDVAGNPWRPVALPYVGRRGSVLYRPGDPVRLDDDARCPWLTPQALSLARVVYAHRPPGGALDPGALAALSDALEEAGCGEPRLLEHLRSPGPHYRGMWSLDLVLGKA